MPLTKRGHIRGAGGIWRRSRLTNEKIVRPQYSPPLMRHLPARAFATALGSSALSILPLRCLLFTLVLLLQNSLRLFQFLLLARFKILARPVHVHLHHLDPRAAPLGTDLLARHGFRDRRGLLLEGASRRKRRYRLNLPRPFLFLGRHCYLVGTCGPLLRDRLCRMQGIGGS